MNITILRKQSTHNTMIMMIATVIMTISISMIMMMIHLIYFLARKQCQQIDIDIAFVYIMNI